LDIEFSFVLDNIWGSFGAAAFSECISLHNSFSRGLPLSDQRFSSGDPLWGKSWAVAGTGCVRVMVASCPVAVTAS
jgi:hypothetical protein